MTLRYLGRTCFDPVYDEMRRFTATRDATTPDELWVTEHDPVYTIGAAGRDEHLPRTNNGIAMTRIDSPPLGDETRSNVYVMSVTITLQQTWRNWPH